MTEQTQSELRKKRENGVTKLIQIKIEENGKNEATISGSIAWDPGREPDFFGDGVRTANGWTFTFEDSFGNTGSVEVIRRTPKTVDVVFDVKKVTEPAPLRQLGEYTGLTLAD